MTVELEKIRAKDYDERECRTAGDKDSPCVICGRTIKNYMTAKSVKWLRMYGGGEFLTDDMETPDGQLENDMGCFPCGAACYKKFLAMGV